MNLITKTASVIVVILGAAAIYKGPAKYDTLEFTGGQLGGGWYTMASGVSRIVMAKYPEITIKVVPGGGITNPSKVQIGKSSMGFGLDVFSRLAYEGRGIYSKRGPHDKTRMIGMSFSDTYFHFVRARDAEYDLESLMTVARDQHIGVTKVGSSDEQTTRWIMDIYGTSYDELREQQGFKINLANYSEVSGQFKDRQIDYAFVNLGLPAAVITEMALSRPAELQPIPGSVLTGLQDKFGFRTGIIPANTYKGQQSDIDTLMFSTILVVSADISTETVYKITKAICEDEHKLKDIHSSMSVFSCATAMNNPPIPIHPGAAKYFDEHQ